MNVNQRFRIFFEDHNEKRFKKLTSTCDKSQKVENIKGKQSIIPKKLMNTYENSQKLHALKENNQIPKLVTAEKSRMLKFNPMLTKGPKT